MDLAQLKEFVKQGESEQVEFKKSTANLSTAMQTVCAFLNSDCGKIEKWGRGTLDMIRDCKNAGNPLPKFEEIGGGFSVTLPLKEPMRTIIYEESKKANLEKLTNRQKEIINFLQKGPLNRQQLMAKMHTSLKDRTVQLELSKLKNMGLIKSEGKAKAIMWSLVKLESRNDRTIFFAFKKEKQ